MISYGEPEHGLTQGTISQFDVEAAKLGLMGVTIFASSGDQGAPGTYAYENKDHCGYFPQWPASSPYITAVGATMGPESFLSESVCTTASTAANGNMGSAITSGGGFSNLYKRPAWQNTVVETYLSTNTIVSGFNRTGRAYPDLAAMGNNYWVLVAGVWGEVGKNQRQCSL